VGHISQPPKPQRHPNELPYIIVNQKEKRKCGLKY